MSSDTDQNEPNALRDSIDYPQNFAKPRVTLFAELVNALHPGAGGRTIAALLDHRATRHAALNWRAGRRAPPKWALELLASKIHAHATMRLAIAARATAAPERAGIAAGAKNLAAWKARQKT